MALACCLAGIGIATNPGDVIEARQELMEHIELPGAVPHLFQATTNRYDPKAALPETLALAPIWSDFQTFYRLAGAAVAAAEGMASAQGTPALRAASLKLRGSCDACHALFLRKHVPPRVQESDRQFDFDAALKGN